MKFESSCWIFFLVLIILFVLFNQSSLKEELTPYDSYNANPRQWSIDQSFRGCMSQHKEDANFCRILAHEIINNCGNAPKPGSSSSTPEVKKFSKCAACLVPNVHAKFDPHTSKSVPYIDKNALQKCLNVASKFS